VHAAAMARECPNVPGGALSASDEGDNHVGGVAVEVLAAPVFGRPCPGPARDATPKKHLVQQRPNSAGLAPFEGTAVAPNGGVAAPGACWGLRLRPYEHGVEIPTEVGRASLVAQLERYARDVGLSAAALQELKRRYLR
jgi:hypothetical protein